MASIRNATVFSSLIFDTTVSVIEKTNLSDIPANRKTSAKIIEKTEAEITLNVFDYGAYFPKSAKVEQQYSLVIAKTYL